MRTIESVVRGIQRELTPQFEQKLRSFLEQQEKEWLVEQVIRLTLDAHSLLEMDRKAYQEMKARAREARLARVRAMHFDLPALKAFINQFKGLDRQTLVETGYLASHAPEKGTAMITDLHRSERGSELLRHAKDVLFVMLFGDESTNTHLQRLEQELLTITVPQFKASALDFMKATTELSAFGTWQDPESVSNDQRADNTLLQVEYGEVEGEWVGAGIVTALSLINNLEVNEQILYARMENVEQSTLIT